MSETLDYGEKLFAEGMIEESKFVFYEILKEEPENLDALNYLGIIAYQEGSLEDSTRFFKKALSIDPYYKSTVLNICEVYRNINNLSSVRPYLKKIIEKYPDDEKLQKLLEDADNTEEKQSVDFVEKEDVNTPEHWDSTYQREIGGFEWRRNIVSFGKVKSVLGILGENNDTLLDIGCGYGLLLDLLRPLNFRLCGWDLSTKAIKTITDKGHDGRCLDFTKYIHSDSDIVDHVISSEMLEHVKDPHDILKKMYILARKTIIIAVPDDCLEDEKEHLQCFNEKSLRVLIESFSFKKTFIDSCLEEFQYATPIGTTDMIKRPTLLAILVK